MTPQQALDLVKNREVVQITLPTQRALNLWNGKYSVVNPDNATNLKSGIWLTLQNFPGRNRGLKIYFHCLLPMEIKSEVLSLDDRLELFGTRKLQMRLDEEDIAKLDEKLEKFGRYCLAAIYIYGVEDENPKDI